MNTLRIVRVASALGLLLALVLLTACAGTAQSVTTPPASGESAASASGTPPTLELVEPAEGATVPAGTVKVAVTTTGLTFVMPSNTNVAGEGHVHFTLDDRPFIMSTEQQAELKDVEPGSHRLVAELVQNNTQSFNPPIRVVIKFIAE